MNKILINQHWNCNICTVSLVTCRGNRQLLLKINVWTQLNSAHITDLQTPRGQSSRSRWAGRPRGRRSPARQAWDRTHPPGRSWPTVRRKQAWADPELSTSCRCSVCVSPLKGPGPAASRSPPQPSADEAEDRLPDGCAAPAGRETSSTQTLLKVAPLDS